MFARMKFAALPGLRREPLPVHFKLGTMSLGMLQVSFARTRGWGGSDAPAGSLAMISSHCSSPLKREMSETHVLHSVPKPPSPDAPVCPDSQDSIFTFHFPKNLIKTLLLKEHFMTRSVRK